MPGFKFSPPRLRLAAIIIGICFVIWLPIEENSTIGVRLFAGLLSALGAACTFYILENRQWVRFYTYPLLGLAAGLVMAPLAVGLMAFKVGLHAHTSPDFSPPQVSAVIETTPIWMAAGLLVGTGAGLRRHFGAGLSSER